MSFLFVFIEAGSSVDPRRVDPRRVDPPADTSTESAAADSKAREYLHSRCVFVNNWICSDVVGRHLMCRSCLRFQQLQVAVISRAAVPPPTANRVSAHIVGVCLYIVEM